MKILLVEDNEILAKGLIYSLEQKKYQVIHTLNVENTLKILKTEKIDLAILDVSLPDGNGFDLYRNNIKEKNISSIFLTAKDEEDNIVKGLELGAEDYITKPFSMKILSRKIDVILKRTVLVSQLIFEDGYLSIDMDNVKVSVKGRECSVTPTECRLLRQFLLNRGQLLTYDLLLERLWDSGSQFVDRHALAVNINRLRGKIEDETHKYISNVYGMGYQWIG